MKEDCKIISKKHPTPFAIQMELEVGTMVRDTFQNPGQFVHIRCGEGMLLRRPISVSTTTIPEDPSKPDSLTILFEARGEGTTWLAERQEGEILDVMGLLGNGFSMTEGRYLIVGGGIGIPPMLGCAQHIKGEHTAILGYRSKSHLCLVQEMEQHCAKVRIATDDGGAGYHGYVDALLREELALDANYTAILACGPKPMLKAIATLAKEYKLPCQVSMEERMGCGVGACLVCACEKADGTRAHVCKDGPIFDANEVVLG
ncbi:MAG: dihydroorotate dehydrogenase electron transfer subunit [Eubacteriales bacterium]